MQQLAGPLGLLNPLILQQVAAYGNYSQVCSNQMFQQQQQALMNTSQGPYISPVNLANGQISQVNGMSNGSVTPTSGITKFIFIKLNFKFLILSFNFHLKR
jgi:hypothetical protein